jgi:hypothetical protein
MLYLAVVSSKVADLSTIVARKTGRCRLQWWPDCLLLQWGRGMVLLL